MFDPATELAVRHFQQVRGLSVDGRVGEETYRALSEARWTLGDRLLRYDPERLMRGDDVTALQERLLELGYDAGRADGILGPETETGLRAFQRDYGLTSDGTCGPATLRALRQLGRKVTGGRPQLLRQSASLVDSGPHLIGRRIVVDPGHGGADTGFTAGETTEADLVFDLASRIEGRLAAAGATVYLTRGRDQQPRSRSAPPSPTARGPTSSSRCTSMRTPPSTPAGSRASTTAPGRGRPRRWGSSSPTSCAAR